MAKQPKIGPKIVLDGEREYKQAIDNIKASQRILNSEMEKTTAQYAGNAKSVEALTAKSGIYDKQLEKTKEKIDTNRKALEESTRKHGEADERTQKWQVSLNKAEAELYKLTNKLDNNNKELEEAKKVSAEAAQGMDKLGDELNQADKNVEGLGDSLKKNLTNAAVVAGVVLIADKLKDAAKSVVKLSTDAAAYADNMLTLSTQTGINTDKLQAYNYASELMDVDLNTLTSSMQKHIRAMYNAQKGTLDYTKAYETLKVNALDPTTGALRDSETVYWEVIDALGRMTNETERDATAMLLFGRSAQELNPLIAQGSKGIADLTAEAQKMGAVLSKEALDSLGATDDAMQRLQQAAEIAKRKIGGEMAPEVERAMTKVTSKISSSGDEIAQFAGGALNVLAEGFIFVVDNGKEIVSVLAGIGAGMAVFKGVTAIQTAVTAIKAYKTAATSAATAQTTLNAAQAASPMGLIATAIGLAAGGLTLAAQNAAGLTDEYKKFNKEISQSLDLIESEIGARKEKKELLIAEHNEYGNLTDKLYELSAAENKSNEEKTNMVVIVDQLNKAIPNLNLSINKETGSLNKQKSEVNGLIEANLKLYQVKAAQEDLSRISEAKYKAERDRLAIQKRIAEDETKLAEAEKKYEDGYYDHFFVWSNAGAYKNITQIKNGLVESRRELERTDQTIADLGKEWDYAMKYISDNGDLITSTDEIGNAISNTADQYDKAAQKMGKSIADIKSEMQSLKDAYIDALINKADEYESAFGLFGAPKIDYLDGRIMLENLDSQLKAMQDWRTNMDILATRGVSNSLLNELKAMGLSGINEAQALSTFTDEALKEYNQMWSDRERISGELAANELSDLKAVTDTKLKELEESYYEHGKNSAGSFIKGLHEGLISNKSALTQNMDSLIVYVTNEIAREMYTK